MTHPTNHNGGPPLEDERATNWFCVSREIFDHSIVGIRNRPYTELEAWLSLLAMAQYEPTKRLNKGQIVVLDPGQLMAAHAFLANRWKWSSAKVRRFLDLLMRDAMITRFCNMQNDKRGGNQIQIITICNYMKYRPETDTDRQANQQPDRQTNGNRATSERQASDNNLTRKQINKETKEEESSFEDMSAGADAPLPDEPSPKQKQNYGEALDAFNSYNDLAQRIGLPLARSLTPQRRKNLMARLREHGGHEAWRIAMANIERSAFLRGNNPKGWTANLDFVLQASSFAKLVDGVYGNGAHAAASGPSAHQPESTADRWARLLSDGEAH